MPIDDPLTRLLRDADDSAGSSNLPADLAGAVRLRQAQRVARARRIRIGSSIAVVGVLLVGGLRYMHVESQSEIARLRSEVQSLAAEADALQRQLEQVKFEQSRQDLREQYSRLVATSISEQTDEGPLDRAAEIALCQGDYYAEDDQSRGTARTAYQNVIRDFPSSRWADLARQRLERLEMN